MSVKWYMVSDLNHTFRIFMPKTENIINHMAVVLDRSWSMRKHKNTVVQVADNLIKHLSVRSQELNQETRISIWTFADAHLIKCVIWDMDVLRLPSIAEFYSPDGNTAFVDATLKALDDLSEIPERYGDHSFLVYVITDGEENASRNRPDALAQRLNRLPGHWTVAAMVPDAKGKHEAKRCGFSAGNIEVWDTSSEAGVTEVGSVLRSTSDSYMRARADGVRSTKTLFSTSSAAVNAETIKAADLKPLDRGQYILIPVPPTANSLKIKEFTEECGFPYRTGRGYYELTKAETIQADKEIAIVERAGAGRVYVGRDARNIIGLPDLQTRVKSDHNRDYAVYVQSKSINRNLVVGTKYLYML